MKAYMRIVFVVLFLAVTAVAVRAESSYDIAEFYTVSKPESGTKVVGRGDRVVEAQYILKPTRVDRGKYVVEVTRIGDNLYQVKGTDLCVETRYCHKYTSYREEAVLIVDSNYGYTRGRLIFD